MWLHFRGVPFARWDDGRVYFGINDAREELTSASQPALKRLLEDLEMNRHPLAGDPRHPLFRAQPERWLQISSASVNTVRSTSIFFRVEIFCTRLLSHR